jgi:hypothetical protein
MQYRDLPARTNPKQMRERLGAFQKDETTMLYVKDLPNGAIQPFREWHPSRMKTGLRNQPIGRKIAIL